LRSQLDDNRRPDFVKNVIGERSGVNEPAMLFGDPCRPRRRPKRPLETLPTPCKYYVSADLHI